jgi:hypothetical protein
MFFQQEPNNSNILIDIERARRKKRDDEFDTTAQLISKWLWSVCTTAPIGLPRQKNSDGRHGSH